MAIPSLAGDMEEHQLSIPSEADLPSTFGNVYTLLAAWTFLHMEPSFRLPSLVCTSAQHLGDGYGDWGKKKKQIPLNLNATIDRKTRAKPPVCTPAFTDTPLTLLCNEEQFQVQRRNFQPTPRHVGSYPSAVQWHQRLGPKTNRGCASLSLWSVLSLWRPATGQNVGWRAPLHKDDGHCCTYVAVYGTRASRPKSTTSSWVAFQ